MRSRGYLRETPWQHSSAGPGGLWLMQTAPAGGYGEHMPGWDMQHPLIRQSICRPRAPAQLCWLLQEVAEPSLVLSLPLGARPAVPLLPARPRPWARAAPGSCPRTSIATCNVTAPHGSSPGLALRSWARGDRIPYIHCTDGPTASSSAKRTRHKHYIFPFAPTREDRLPRLSTNKTSAKFRSILY